ncbi:MAG: ribosomal large subunit pseudouridine synthase [Polaromonas sp.]|nr:ribosomal large subunit pseudouridine synthase [Polaromonas sp.]
MTDTGQGTLIISSKELAADVREDAGDEADDLAIECRKVFVPVENHGARLDRALADMVPEFSRSYLQQLIAAGAVQLNGAASTKPSTRVKASDRLQVELKPTPQSQAFKPEAMALDIVFEDPFLMVVNKPAGLVVHPAPGNWSGTLLNGLLGRDAQASFLPRAGIVHRLDKDTSGLMVVARQRQVMDQLVHLIAAREVNRQYIALAHGPWSGRDTAHVDLPVGRDPRNRLRMAVVNLDKNPGKSAVTDISVLESAKEYCLVKCKLHTGRTHQIRVHMAALGHPLLADELYGGRPAGGMQRQALHAVKLAFTHPVTGTPLQFRAPLPDDLSAAITAVGLRYNPAS